MLSFEEIEDCFPEDGATTEENGMLCSAQWLHDFAHAVAAKEREACASIAEKCKYQIPYKIGLGEIVGYEVHSPKQAGWAIAGAIRQRSNV